MNSTATGCELCGIQLQSLLMTIRILGVHRQICPGCVLVNHPTHFCPHCFDLHKQHSPPLSRTMCITCPSIGHASCVAAATNSRTPILPYTCPNCSDRNFRFFDIQKNQGRINQHLAKQLLAAAKISLDMRLKEVEWAKIAAEVAGMEATSAKRNAKEALEKVCNRELDEDVPGFIDESDDED